MTKLSELKVGDRFTVEAVVTRVKYGVTTFQMIGRSLEDTNCHEYGDYEVTKLLDPPRNLVKGERINAIRFPFKEGEYLGRDWAWWDGELAPHRLTFPATTEHYVVTK